MRAGVKLLEVEWFNSRVIEAGRVLTVVVELLLPDWDEANAWFIECEEDEGVAERRVGWTRRFPFEVIEVVCGGGGVG